MMIQRRQFLRLTAGAAAISASTQIANAQAFPSRPITMVVPVPAGGAMDAVARILAEGMRASLGQTVIIDNVTGASGSIGVGRVARAQPDGYTLSYAALVTHVVNPAVLDLPYDVFKDFAPIAPVARTPWMIAANSNVPANNLKELIAWLKANPDKVSFGTAGVGSPSHLGGVLFQNMTGTRFRLVPYRGTAPVVPDLISGQVELSILDPVTSLPQLRSGRLKIFAVLSPNRSADAPDIPTVDEVGLAGLYISPWHGIWAPAGTPDDVIKRLNAAVVDALASETVRKQLSKLSYETWPREQQTPAGLAAFHKEEIERWWPVIKEAGLKKK